MKKNADTKETSAALPVGIWIRVSTDIQAKGDSPENHEARARMYAQMKGWIVVKVYRLEGLSGKSVKDYPETKEMVEDVKSGRISALIFSKLARLARNTKELIEFSELFREFNADLISLDESIDTSSAVGRFFYTVIAAMAQWEREEIASRVAASVPIRAKLGKPIGGAAPFGYMYQDKKLVPNAAEAPVRKQIYELFLEHKRIKTVARLLNEGGHRTRNGSKFTGTTVERLLRDTTAKGVHRANYTKSTGNNKKWILKPQEEWVLREVEPVIPAELWEQCNQMLDGVKMAKRLPTRKNVKLFSGFAYCACGSKMYLPSNTPKYVCPKCHNKISKSDLEGIFHEQLKAFLFSPEEVSNYLSKADQVLKERQELLKVLMAERNKAAEDMDKMMKLYLAGELPQQGFGRQYQPLEERFQQVEAKIPELQGEIDYLKVQYASSDEILSEARDLYSRWPSLSRENKRQVVESITDTIVIGVDDVTINLCGLTPSELINDGKVMKRQGFIAATNWNWDG